MTAPAGAPRVFALSDVHADLPENMAWLRALPATDYLDAVLLLAGDVSDDLAVLGRALAELRRRFSRVFFVPGNHELWVRRREAPDSLAKLEQVRVRCDELGVETRPARVGGRLGDPGVRIVPLLAWYAGPEEGPDSLYLPKPGEDPTLRMWSDRYFTAWPASGPGPTVAERFLALNEPHLEEPGDRPVISFSHFLPRREVMLSTPDERRSGEGPPRDPHPTFNFSRVAGTAGLERQIRRLGSAVHVHGHQHRDRDRWIDGVRYVSRCLGYPRERAEGFLPAPAPFQVWPPPPAA